MYKSIRCSIKTTYLVIQQEVSGQINMAHLKCQTQVLKSDKADLCVLTRKNLKVTSRSEKRKLIAYGILPLKTHKTESCHLYMWNSLPYICMFSHTPGNHLYRSAFMWTERVHVRLLTGVTSRRARETGLWLEGFDLYHILVFTMWIYSYISNMCNYK